MNSAVPAFAHGHRIAGGALEVVPGETIKATAQRFAMGASPNCGAGPGRFLNLFGPAARIISAIPGCASLLSFALIYAIAFAPSTCPQRGQNVASSKSKRRPALSSYGRAPHIGRTCR
jgi:hypothetical protein